MASYVLCGTEEHIVNTVRKIYVGTIYQIVTDQLPEPNDEYTVIMTTYWHKSPLRTHPSLATFLLNAKLVEYPALAPFNFIYENHTRFYCEHVKPVGKSCTIKSGDDYAVLCSLCVAIYAINGLPELSELFSEIGGTDNPAMKFISGGMNESQA